MGQAFGAPTVALTAAETPMHNHAISEFEPSDPSVLTAAPTPASAIGIVGNSGFNAFAAGATRQGVVRKMPADVLKAYEAPYDSWTNRISTLRVVQDIPLAPGDRAWDLVEDAGKRLPIYADRPAFIGWGLRDFVFDQHFLKGFTQALPKAEVHAFEDAGHYVLEDKADELVPAIRQFLDRS